MRVSAAGIAWISSLLVLLSCSVSGQDRQVPSPEPARTSPLVKQLLTSYEGQNVSSVEIAGRPDLDTEPLKAKLPQKAGQPFSMAKVQQSIADLEATGQFKNVQLQVVPDIRGVRVMFVLEPGLYFGIYRFSGALKKFAYPRLLQIAQYPPEGPYTDFDVNRDARLLFRFYERNGYFKSQVNPQLQTDSAHGLVNVDFTTTLGEKAKFGNIVIEGTTPQEAAKLRSTLMSLMARLKGAAIRPGKGYSYKTVQNAQQRLENTLNSQGYLANEVKLRGAMYDPATNRADVMFAVKSGPIVHVKVQGAFLWSWTRHSLLPIYEQVGFDREIIEEGRENLVSYFQKKGYFTVSVTVNVQKQTNGEDIVYRVVKGPRHKVNEVSLKGNKTLGGSELMPQVTVKEGGFLSHGAYSEKLVTQSVKNLKAAYQAAGFSDVQVTPKVTYDDNGNLNVSFLINEGPRDIVASLQLVGNATMPVSKLAPKGLKVIPGHPYSQKLVNEDRTQITSTYLNSGYLTATFRETVSEVKNNRHLLDVVYHITEGPKVTTNSVIVDGGKHTRKSFIYRTAGLKAGTPMTEKGMLSAESRLYEPNIFDWAEVDPRRHITTQNREDVVIKLHEAKKNSITYGGGFEVINRGGSLPSGTVAVPGIPPIGLPNSFRTSEKTFWGPRGHVEYRRRNVRGKAESIILAAIAGRLDQRGSFDFHNPHLRQTNWASTFSILGEHDSTNPIFTSRLGEAGYQIQRNINGKDKTLFIRYGFRETGLTRLLIPDLVPPEDRHVRLSTLSSSFIRDTRDSPLDAHHGIYESFELGITPEAFGSNVSFARLLGQTAYYKPLPAGIVWANSLRLGFEKPFSGSHVPISEKFFSGGGSTLRGFPLNGAGPQRTITACGNPSVPSTCAPINVPTGGNQLVILNSEFRIPVPIKKGLGVVGFYDGGNVFRTIGFHGQYTNTVGFGFRYETPVGPIRIDVGHNLNAPPGIKATQYFITLGQAF